MISVSEAKFIITRACKAMEPVNVDLESASHHVLAVDLTAPFSIPGFVQSSMDGYAFAFDGYKPGSSLTLKGERAAGSSDPLELLAGEACRIFTGAALPPGADTVVMQEKTRVESGNLFITDPKVEKGQFVRSIGAEVEKGGLLLRAGTMLKAPAISYLAATGITRVSVYPFPRVSIIVTGNEFQPRGEMPAYGLIYESNSLGLKAALNAAGIPEVTIYHARDSLSATKEPLQKALSNSDLVLLTGGVSVGEYDFVVTAARDCGINPGFHKVKQKPGKPLLFGMKDQVPVFGLPGNPSSVLTCYYEYVLPAIQKLSGLPLALKEVQAKLQHPVVKPAGLTHFMKATYQDGSVHFLNAQESFRLSSFATANCLLVVGEEITSVDSGEMVTIHLLP